MQLRLEIKVMLLIDAGVDLNVTNLKGYMALVAAAESWCDSCVLALLQAECDACYFHGNM